MLWLLVAEIRKLARPLVWGTALAIVAFCLLITWGAASNARAALASPRIPDVCAQATAAVTIGSMLLALLAAGIAGIGQLSPATFVQAWMGFGPAGYLPTNFWSRFISGSEHTGQLAGLLGVLLTAAVAAVIARWRFAADVTA